MTAQELFYELAEVVKSGYGHAEVLFDTEARTFEYHMAQVKFASLETEFDPDRPIVVLVEG